MGRVEGVGGAHFEKAERDPILEWFSRMGTADEGPAEYHPRCRCWVVRDNEGKKRLLTTATACALCRTMEDFYNKQAIVSTIKVEEVPEGVEPKALAKVLTHLERLVEKYPKGVPSDGIRLNFAKLPKNTRGVWRDDQRRMSLSTDHFGTMKGQEELTRRLAASEQKMDNPLGCQTPEYVVTHEFGHCLRHRLNVAKYASWWMKADKQAMGSYAARNASDGFAKGFSMIVHTPMAEWPADVRLLYNMLREDGVL